MKQTYDRGWKAHAYKRKAKAVTTKKKADTGRGCRISGRIGTNRFQMGKRTASPDIRYLPRLAVLYRTSIDAMFNMESCWDEEHRKNFLEKINALHQKRDTEGVYQAWIAEIELKPDRFSDYITVMIYVLQNGLLMTRTSSVYYSWQIMQNATALRMISETKYIALCCRSAVIQRIRRSMKKPRSISVNCRKS